VGTADCGIGGDMFECYVMTSRRSFRVIAEGFATYEEACEWRDQRPNFDDILIRQSAYAYDD
jgi:hypothetical protein